jgi:hypothetical protein
VNGGYTTGILYGTNPVYADQMVLRQDYTLSAFQLGFGVSFPAGLTVSGSGCTLTYSWVSSAVPHIWELTAPHDSLSVTCLLPSPEYITVADGADMYIGSNIYKARTSITKNFTDLRYL